MNSVPADKIMSECLVPLQAAEIAISKVAAFLADDDQLDEAALLQLPEVVVDLLARQPEPPSQTRCGLRLAKVLQDLPSYRLE